MYKYTHFKCDTQQVIKVPLTPSYTGPVNIGDYVYSEYLYVPGPGQWWRCIKDSRKQPLSISNWISVKPEELPDWIQLELLLKG